MEDGDNKYEVYADCQLVEMLNSDGEWLGTIHVLAYKKNIWSSLWVSYCNLSKIIEPCMPTKFGVWILKKIKRWV